MNIRDIRTLKQTAGQRLAQSRNAGKVLLIYLGATTGIALAVTLFNYILDLKLDNYGGLSNLGMNTFLSTIQMALMLSQPAVLLCLEMGYLSAMLRTGRGQYTSPNAFRLGFARFWPILRCLIVQSGLYFAVIFGCAYLASILYMITPFSREFLELILSGAISAPIAVDSPEFARILPSLMPMMVIYCILLAVFLIPISYNYRMIYYLVIDHPAMGGFAVLRESRRMMRRNRLALLKLDLSFWWFYLLQAAIVVMSYGEQILPMFGITLPLSMDAQYYLFYFLSLAVQAGLYWLFLNRVQTTYALAYESLRPRQEESGVVLGNIFRM